MAQNSDEAPIEWRKKIVKDEMSINKDEASGRHLKRDEGSKLAKRHEVQED